MLNIPCVIFAGGKSSRMGEDKSLLPFGRFNTLTEFQLSHLSKIFKTVYISCKNREKFNFSANFIEDLPTDKVFAPTAGFISIFRELKDDSFFAISVDTPFIDKKTVNKIIEADNPHLDATIAKLRDKMQPMCGIYHRSLENRFTHMLKTENHKLGFLLNSSKTSFVDFSDEKPFLNLNHPHEYQEALTLIGYNTKK
ncbi:MAG: molybdenum cofactor guanylyltransferase MobA [Sulfurimonas sp.]|nr:molybdenum cofactor guanylyltransferase MobA [Sulfurimonas sp.]